MTPPVAFKDLDFRGNVYRVYGDGTAELIECRNTIPSPDTRLTRVGMGSYWKNQSGDIRASALTQKLNIIVSELEMEAREGVQS